MNEPEKKGPSGLRVFLHLVGVLLVFIALNIINAPTISPQLPLGVVELEFAWTLDDALSMKRYWETKGVLSHAIWNTWLDYLFMLAYGSATYVGCMYVGHRFSKVRKISVVLAFAGAISALFDAVENIGMLAILYGSQAEYFPKIIVTCAYIKFALITPSSLWAFFGVVIASLIRMERAVAETKPV